MNPRGEARQATKLALKLSLFGNLLLVLTCAVLSIRPWSRGDNVKALAPIPAPAASTNVQPKAPGAAPRAAGFCWQQLESTDYRTYVANLRAIGCPERTLGDIVRADVHGLFADKRKALGVDERAVSGAWSTAEEGRVIALLTDTAPPEPTGKTNTLTAEAIFPAVLEDLENASLGLDSQQREAYQELKSSFIERIGGPSQDPTDPSYAAKWREAQAESDQLLRGTIGVNAFMQLQNGQ